jgi:membrane protein YqaA with SNARE-associated domain
MQPAMLRRLYDWCIGAAGTPHAAWIMAAVSFAESSFFPVPPDIMLIPMTLARADRAWRYAAICTIASVTGGMLGYLIGALLYDSVGQWIVTAFRYGDKIEAVREGFAQYGGWIILLKGATPIPYKIVTIASGFSGYNFGAFVALSLVTRGLRFFVEAFLLKRYGPQARTIIEKRLGFWVTVSALVLVAGFVAVAYLV